MAAALERARESLALYLTWQGLKHTRQRDSILEAFFAQRGHVTSEELHHAVREAYPEIGAATVYRTLKIFVSAGIANASQFREGVTVYEHRLEHHDHLVCLGCNKIVEFENALIESEQDRIASRNHFRLVRHRHDLFGFCPDCRKAGTDREG